jgi:hypothetical protein
MKENEIRDTKQYASKDGNFSSQGKTIDGEFSRKTMQSL